MTSPDRYMIAATQPGDWLREITDKDDDGRTIVVVPANYAVDVLRAIRRAHDDGRTAARPDKVRTAVDMIAVVTATARAGGTAAEDPARGTARIALPGIGAALVFAAALALAAGDAAVAALILAGTDYLMNFSADDADRLTIEIPIRKDHP